jgi:hypothetical protein
MSGAEVTDLAKRYRKALANRRLRWILGPLSPGHEDGSPRRGTSSPPDARESGVVGGAANARAFGRFRFGDAAFRGSTVKTIASWEQQITAAPGDLHRDRTAADLERAARERKVGLIYGFPGELADRRGLDRIDLFQRLACAWCS